MNASPTIAAILLPFLALPAQDAQVPEPRKDQISAPSSTEGATRFSQDRLEQLVAPIALYPDALLGQILMASTYPLEIVQADRWLEQNPGLSGSALEEALKAQEWDPSVKSLCGFPTVLKKMDEDLSWTRDLGDAFLAQKSELMDTVQTMRKKALDAGTLRTTNQQSVAQQDGQIVVQSASPDVIYVPAYSPVVVYGPGWYYPYWYYPYWYYPPPYGGGFVTFSVGFFWGFGCWSHCDWHHHTVFVDTVVFRNFHARTSTAPLSPQFVDAAASSGGQVPWTHDPSHRMGVAYRSPKLTETFSRGSPPSVLSPRVDRGSPRVEIPRGRPEMPRVPPATERSRPLPPPSRMPPPMPPPSRTPPRDSRASPPFRESPAPTFEHRQRGAGSERGSHEPFEGSRHRPPA